MNFFKRIYIFFDKLEDHIRARLTRRPIIYAFIGSVGVVLIWRGIWTIADDIYMPGWISLVIGIVLTLSTGLFVSLFIGENIIISGINKEKRIDEKTEDEIKKEETVLENIENDLKDIKNKLIK